jgi:hypothetical protein
LHYHFFNFDVNLVISKEIYSKGMAGSGEDKHNSSLRSGGLGELKDGHRHL